MAPIRKCIEKRAELQSIGSWPGMSIAHTLGMLKLFFKILFLSGTLLPVIAHAELSMPGAKLKRLKVRLIGVVPTADEYREAKKQYDSGNLNAYLARKTEEFLAEPIFNQRLVSWFTNEQRYYFSSKSGFTNPFSTGGSYFSNRSDKLHRNIKYVDFSFLDKNNFYFLNFSRFKSFNKFYLHSGHKIKDSIRYTFFSSLFYPQGVDEIVVNMEKLVNLGLSFQESYEHLYGIENYEFKILRNHIPKMKKIVEDLGLVWEFSKRKSLLAKVARKDRKKYEEYRILVKESFQLAKTFGFDEFSTFIKKPETQKLIGQVVTKIMDLRANKLEKEADGTLEDELPEVELISKEMIEKFSSTFLDTEFESISNKPIQSGYNDSRDYRNIFSQTKYSQAAAFYRDMFCDQMTIQTNPTESLSLNLIRLTNNRSGKQVVPSEDFHSKSECSSCHSKLDPAQELFDSPKKIKKDFRLPLPHYRNDSRTLVIRPGEDLLKKAMSTNAYRSCQVRKTWKWIVGDDVPITSSLEEGLVDIFKETDGHIPSLVREMVMQKEFYGFDIKEKDLRFTDVKPIFQRCYSCHVEKNAMVTNLLEYPFSGWAMESNEEVINSIVEELDFEHLGEVASMPEGYSLSTGEFKLLGEWINQGGKDESGTPRLRLTEKLKNIVNTALQKIDDSPLKFGFMNDRMMMGFPASLRYLDLLSDRRSLFKKEKIASIPRYISKNSGSFTEEGRGLFSSQHVDDIVELLPDIDESNHKLTSESLNPNISKNIWNLLRNPRFDLLDKNGNARMGSVSILFHDFLESIPREMVGKSGSLELVESNFPWENLKLKQRLIEHTLDTSYGLYVLNEQERSIKAKELLRLIETNLDTKEVSISEVYKYLIYVIGSSPDYLRY